MQHTFPASCHATPVRASTTIAPRLPNIAHLPWISSHSLNICNPNTSIYGRNGVGFSSVVSLITPITSPATFLAKFWSKESKSNCNYSAGLAKPKGSNPRSPIISRLAGRQWRIQNSKLGKTTLLTKFSSFSNIIFCLIVF